MNKVNNTLLRSSTTVKMLLMRANMRPVSFEVGFSGW